jgi:hypothetical protein
MTKRFNVGDRVECRVSAWALSGDRRWFPATVSETGRWDRSKTWVTIDGDDHAQPIYLSRDVRPLIEGRFDDPLV